MEQMELKKLITLGPSGTFSEVAALKLSEALNEEYKIEFYPTILLAAKNIAANGFGILPFENTLDGYVQETLDMLHKYNFYILMIYQFQFILALYLRIVILQMLKRFMFSLKLKDNA